jgi:hypothetical protein
MDWFTPVSSATRWPTIQLGYGGVAGADGTLASPLYQRKDAADETALVSRDAFLDAVPGRASTGSAWKIPEPGSSSEASGILPAKADWLTWAADSVKDRLDLSAGYRLAAWKAESGTVSTLLDVEREKRAPTWFHTVSDAYREAPSGGTSALLSSSASGNALSDIYTRLMRGSGVSPLFSVWA